MTVVRDASGAPLFLENCILERSIVFSDSIK